MTAMKKKDLDRFREILLEERNKLLHHLEDLSSSSRGDLGDSVSGDSADIASLEINQAALQKIGKRESKLLKKIDYALGKIEDKTYGECENCGEPIGVKRLMARPVAQLCIDCKTEQESVERRYSTFGDEDDSALPEDEEIA